MVMPARSRNLRSRNLDAADALSGGEPRGVGEAIIDSRSIRAQSQTDTEVCVAGCQCACAVATRTGKEKISRLKQKHPWGVNAQGCFSS
jgi:hypothetical protein